MFQVKENNELELTSFELSLIAAEVEVGTAELALRSSSRFTDWLIELAGKWKGNKFAQGIG